MNIWMDIAIPALVTVVALTLTLALLYTSCRWQQEEITRAGLSFDELLKEKAALELQVVNPGVDGQALRIAQLLGENAKQKDELEERTAERDAALRERDEAIHMFNGLQPRFDALKAEIEAIKQSKPTRNSRKKTEAASVLQQE